MPPQLLSDMDFIESLREAHKKWFSEWKKDAQHMVLPHCMICYMAYRNAAKTSLKFLVAGRIPNDTDWKDKPGIDDLVRANFDVTSEWKKGAVLNTNAWTPVLNDSWILGGVHANLPFYLASPREEATFASRQHRLSVTARELVGLTNFGYEVVQQDKLGEVMVCKDEKAAKKASFAAYVKLWEDALRDPAQTIEELVNLKVTKA